MSLMLLIKYSIDSVFQALKENNKQKTKCKQEAKTTTTREKQLLQCSWLITKRCIPNLNPLKTQQPNKTLLLHNHLYQPLNFILLLRLNTPLLQVHQTIRLNIQQQCPRTHWTIKLPVPLPQLQLKLCHPNQRQRRSQLDLQLQIRLRRHLRMLKHWTLPKTGALEQKVNSIRSIVYFIINKFLPM